jgi:hypothetical protein
MQNSSNSHLHATSGDATITESERSALRRRRLVQLAVFGGSVVATLAVAAPAMAWPAMGC